MVNRFPRFELEDYFRRFAFKQEMVNLSPSNPISPTVGEILEIAGMPPTALQGLSLDYSETAGAWPLREAIATLYDDLQPDQVIVTSGGVEAIMLTLEALIRPGTSVVMETPIYGSYEPLLRLLGAQITYYELAEDDAYEYDLERLERLVLDNRAELLVVNPYNNPTGRGIASTAALSSLAELSSRTGCKVISDEVFRQVTIDGDPLPSLLDGAQDAIVISDMTKAWGLGGLRIGWMASRDNSLLERALNTRDFTTNSNSIVSEELALHALSARRPLLEASLAKAREALADLSRFIADSHGALSWHPPIGGYCAWLAVNVDAGMSVPDLCSRLAEKQNYLILPGVVFGARWSRFLRVGLAAGGKQLVAGLDAFLQEASAT
jgi:aspartate/methionine/tyrosine aminotransferase